MTADSAPPPATIIYEISASRGSEGWNEGLFRDWQNAADFIEDHLEGKRAADLLPHPLATDQKPGERSGFRWQRRPLEISRHAFRKIEYRIIPRPVLDWPCDALEILIRPDAKQAEEALQSFVDTLEDWNDLRGGTFDRLLAWLLRWLEQLSAPEGAKR